MDIGTKIKQLRLANDLTLEELADRSELTKGFLSQVERNRTSPSISTLEDILEALGTNLAQFFKEDEQEQVVFGKEDYFVSQRDGHIIEWIVPNAQKNEMEPIVLTLPKGGKSEVLRAHHGEEFGYVLKGTIRLVIGQEVYLIKAKETFYLNHASSHFLENAGNKEAKVLWITTPPMF